MSIFTEGTELSGFHDIRTFLIFGHRDSEDIIKLYMMLEL